MLGARFTANIYVDGEIFNNQLVKGDSDNCKKKLITRVMKNFKAVMFPKWMAEHKVTLRITDRLTNETFDI